MEEEYKPNFANLDPKVQRIVRLRSNIRKLENDLNKGTVPNTYANRVKLQMKKNDLQNKLENVKPKIEKV